MKFKKFLVMFLIFLVFLIPLVYADVLDVRQENDDGEPFEFYYDGHRSVRQFFVPESISQVTKVQLKMEADTSSTWDPCSYLGRQYEKFDLFIEDESSSVIAEKRDISICNDLPLNRFDWAEFTLDHVWHDLEPGRTYQIYIFYRGNALSSSPNLAWERSDAGDLTYRIYGEEAPTCDSDISRCHDDDTIKYQQRDCNWRYEDCPAHHFCHQISDGWVECQEGANMHIDRVNIQGDGSSTTSLHPGEVADFSAVLFNRGGIRGTFDTYFNVFRGGGLFYDLHDFLDLEPRGGDYGLRMQDFTVPDDWCGQYEFRVDTDPCYGSSTCQRSMNFEVRGTCPEYCTDHDGDGYYADCEPFDCNDDNAAENVERTVDNACGLNGRGSQRQTCQEGRWVNAEGGCTDADVCIDSASEEQTCGLNDRGVQSRTCVDGHWGDYSACDDPDTCENGQTQSCGASNVGECRYGTETCIDGYWGECFGAVEPVPEESGGCNSLDDDCDGEIDESFDFFNDEDNCGGCGLVCETYEHCAEGICQSSADFESLIGKEVVIDPELFYLISRELLNQEKVNQVFFEEESEEDAEDILMPIVADLKNFNDGLEGGMETFSDGMGFPVLAIEQYSKLIDANVLSGIVGSEHIVVYENGDLGFLALGDESAVAKWNYAQGMVEQKNNLVRGLRGAADIMSWGLSIYFGATHADGDFGKFLTYSGTHGLYFNVLPHMAAISFLRVFRDTAFGIVGVDPDEITCDLNPDNFLTVGECSFWLANGVIDVMTDLDVAEALDGECGLLNGEFPSCINTIGEGIQLFTHPLAIIEDISPDQDIRRVIFTERLRDYSLTEPLFDEVWIGATVLTEDYLGCNYDLSPQQVSFTQGEEKEITFTWNVPDDFPKDELLNFASKVWYNCLDCRDVGMYCDACAPLFGEPDWMMCDACTRCSDFLPYEQCNPGEDNYYYCYGDDLEGLEIALSSENVDFVVENHPPRIIRQVISNNFEGGEVVISIDADDPDGDSLTYSINDRRFRRGTGNSFHWQTEQGDAGEYFLTVTVEDDYEGSDSESFVLRIEENQPRLISPERGEITRTQSPTFQWRTIVGGDQYQIHLYSSEESELRLHSAYALNEEAFCSLGNCEYEWPGLLNKDRIYWWEVVAVHQSGERLSSERQWFMVDCYADWQCGTDSWRGEAVCLDGDVYQNRQTFTCHHPGTLDSFCADETDRELKEECEFGCLEGVEEEGETRCLRGCEFDEPGCGEGYQCIENHCREIDHDDDGIGVLSDCNDEDFGIYPGAEESCDGIDNDCDGEVDEIFDFSGLEFCGACGVICEDDERCADGICQLREGCAYHNPDCGEGYDCVDNECIEIDDDGDGVSVLTDCDDHDPAIFPGAEETCDGEDNNCNGEIDEDLARTVSGSCGWNGRGSLRQGCQEGGWIDLVCNDLDQCLLGEEREFYSEAEETLGEGICRAGRETCLDIDGVAQMTITLEEVLPQEEICGNGLDENCNAEIDEGCCSGTTLDRGVPFEINCLHRLTLIKAYPDNRAIFGLYRGRRLISLFYLTDGEERTLEADGITFTFRLCQTDFELQQAVVEVEAEPLPSYYCFKKIKIRNIWDRFRFRFWR